MNPYVLIFSVSSAMFLSGGLIAYLTTRPKNKEDGSSTYVQSKLRADLRIKIEPDITNHFRYFPQKRVGGEWFNILCTNDLGWYKVPMFTGYSDMKNAEINIEHAEMNDREAIEYYKK